ncbi:hypothetical protein SprV_0802603800 [Sparganum proliferum]
MLHSLQPSAWFQVLALLCLNFFSVSAGGDIGWPNSNRLVLLVHSNPYDTEADIYVNWPVESPDRLLSLDVIADPEEAVCPQLPRINKTAKRKPEMTLGGLKKNCKYTVTVTVRTHFNELGLSEVRKISTDETSYEKVNYARTSHKTDSFNVSADKLPSSPCLIALNSDRKCRLVVYNSNSNRSEVCTLRDADAVGDDDDGGGGGDDDDDEVGNDADDIDDDDDNAAAAAYDDDDDEILPPQNVDWVITPTSKTELSVVLKYRPPATNIDLLKNFTFVILERGAEKERIIVSVGEEVSPQTKGGSTISVTTEQVRHSQADDSVFLSVALRSRLSQGKQHELRVFTNGDEVGQSTFTLTPPIFAPPAPDVVKAMVTGPGIINASWSPVTVFRGKEVYYKAACDSMDWQFDPPGRLTTLSAVFGRLSDCTQYKCRVMAVAVGDGRQEAKSKPVFSDTVRTWPPSKQ